MYENTPIIMSLASEMSGKSSWGVFEHESFPLIALPSFLPASHQRLKHATISHCTPRQGACDSANNSFSAIQHHQVHNE